MKHKPTLTITTNNNKSFNKYEIIANDVNSRINNTYNVVVLLDREVTKTIVRSLGIPDTDKFAPEEITIN